MERSHKRPSHTWRTFLENHAQQLVSIDFFTVPTIRFQVLYVFLVLAHDRRRILHFNVTAHPTADWTGQQLREAFPFIQLPRYLLRDRDAIFGHDFREQLRDMGICEVLSAPRSPWQRAYVERGARQLPERVLEVTTRVFGEEHPDTLTSMWNLGLSFLEVGEVDTALRLLTQCLNNRYKVLGDQHPDTLAAAKFLALRTRIGIRRIITI
jgi:transposase InsO family protein